MRCPILGFTYCLSYTAVLLTFLPDESVPDTVTVRLLPSAATTRKKTVGSLRYTQYPKTLW